MTTKDGALYDNIVNYNNKYRTITVFIINRKKSSKQYM